MPENARSDTKACCPNILVLVRYGYKERAASNEHCDDDNYFPSPLLNIMVGTIGIAGITGKFGRSVARHLLATNPELSLRGYCRNPAKLPSTLSSSSRVTIHQGNSDDPAAVRGFVKGCDVVICSYLGDNTLMTDGQRVLIDACEAEKVKRYVASDYSLDFTKLEYGQLFVKDPMKRVKEYLETKHHVRGVHVLIGVFMETFWSRFFGVWNGRENKLRFWGDGDEKWESTTYDNAAQYVAAVALDESAVGVQKCKPFSSRVLPWKESDHWR